MRGRMAMEDCPQRLCASAGEFVRALGAWLTLCLSACGLWAGGTFRETDGGLRVETPRWAMVLDAKTGAIRGIEDRAGDGVLLRGGGDLWRVERHKENPVVATGCAMRHAWDSGKGELKLEFEGPDAAVTVVCVAAEEGPLWRVGVRMKRGTMVGWDFPARLEFDVSELEEFILPENLGLAFTRQFFEPGGAGVEARPVGARGLLRVAGDRCQGRPTDDAPVAVKPGKDAPGWLPEWYLREMPRWRVQANRCPAGGKHDLALVETEHGPWLSGYRLGGWGWLLRFGGRLEDREARPQMASLIAVLTKSYLTPAVASSGMPVPPELAGKPPVKWPDPPKRIGVVLSRPSARPGVRVEPSPSRWMAELARQAWVKEAGIELVELRDAPAVRAALAEPRRWFAIVSALGEGFVAEGPEGIEAMLDAIKGYVRDGGIWWEAGGGYPFYRALVPNQDMKFATANRDFCDFAALRSASGRWAMFGIQKPEEIFVPRGGEIGAAGPGDARVGHYAHRFDAFARAGQAVAPPPLQMMLGVPHREALREYGRRCGFARGLEAKAKPEMVARLKRCILLKVSTRKLAESARVAETLPSPVLFHIADYLRGGFDKQYPDHLPPHPDVGTPDDLARLIRACREKGHLFMPYTNPTWWCVNPKGPTFERVGEAPLSRDFEGKIYPESYGLTTVQGYTICAWHPAVRAANDVIREQFTKQYPVDVLFQDQVGARGHKWDTNPAAPHPGAYIEGIHRIAHADAKVVPLGTEDGDARLINHELMFCGLSGPWLPNRPSNTHVLYEDLWPEGSWRHEPLALLLAHDKVLFYHHDLGGFVRNRLDLSATLAMGYGLSWNTRSSQPDAAERDWLGRLCRVQAAIGPRCAGRALEEFAYLAPRVIRSRWGDLEIIANLSAEPWEADAATVLAVHGFVARAPDLEAGIFARWKGDACGVGGKWVIREKGQEPWEAEGEP